MHAKMLNCANLGVVTLVALGGEIAKESTYTVFVVVSKRIVWVGPHIYCSTTLE